MCARVFAIVEGRRALGGNCIQGFVRRDTVIMLSGGRCGRTLRRSVAGVTMTVTVPM